MIDGQCCLFNLVSGKKKSSGLFSTFDSVLWRSPPGVQTPGGVQIQKLEIPLLLWSSEGAAY